MPRSSALGKDLRDLRRITEKRGVAAWNRESLSDHDSSEDELDEHWQLEYERVQSSRYVDRPTSYRRRRDQWRKLLFDHEYMNATEFHKHFRLERDIFFRLVDLVRDDPGFYSNGNKPFRGRVELHVLTLLKFLGTYGDDNSGVKLGLFLGIASGSVHNYLHRASAAILNIEVVAMSWPDPEERLMISQRMQEKYDFVNCVGITDGTLFPLAAKPRHHGEAYYSRKSSHSVYGLVTCDDVSRIRNLVVGWPGSTHDNRVWMNSPMISNRGNHFLHIGYLLGDSAFQASTIMIPASKNFPKAQMNQHHKYFNKQLAKTRTTSEHCIGLLKMRFPYLREIRISLSKNRKHMRRLIRLVTCAHNLLIAEPIPQDWQTALVKQITGWLDDDDEPNEAIGAAEDGRKRRNQLLAYLLEVRDKRQQQVNLVL